MNKFREEYRKEVDKISSEVGWTLKKLFWRVIVPIIFLIIVVGAITWTLGILKQPARVIEKTMDADNILYNYEWFKQTHQDVKAIDAKIENARTASDQFLEGAGPRSDWGFQDKEEYARLNSVLLGLKNQRQDIIATYNARSNMANRAIFKSGELPEKID